MTQEALLEKHEGRKYKLYPDTAKPPKWTIGVGWNVTDNPLPPHIAQYLAEHGKITDEMIDQLLAISIKIARSACEDLFPAFDTFSETRQMALIDLLFNMGKFRVNHKFPAFCHNVNIEDWQGAADELKYANGKTKGKLSDYWVQLHGDPDGTDDGKLERPEEIYEMIVGG